MTINGDDLVTVHAAQFDEAMRAMQTVCDGWGRALNKIDRMLMAVQCGVSLDAAAVGELRADLQLLRSDETRTWRHLAEARRDIAQALARKRAES